MTMLHTPLFLKLQDFRLYLLVELPRRQAGTLPDVEGVDDEIELAVYGFQVSHSRSRALSDATANHHGCGHQEDEY
jgi:hypothetical protein